MIRFLVFQKQTRIIALSGMMNNIEEVRLWIGKLRTVTITSTERPIRQLFGVGARTDNTEKLKETNRKGIKKRKVQFAGGIVFIHDEDDLTDDQQARFPGSFSGTYVERYYGADKGWLEDKGDGTNAIDHAISLAQYMVSKVPGAIIVCVSTPASAERACGDFHYDDGLVTVDRMNLADLIANELGRNHPLVGFCRRGIAYHHADLPNNVLRALELALEKDWLKVVFATSTLREGVNTSAKTVIIAGNSFFDAATKRSVMLAEVDFLNMAGRAGRPRYDTQGVIILIPDATIMETAVQVGKMYILAEDSALRVTSQWRGLAEAIAGKPADLLQLPVHYQSLILGLIAAGISDEPALSEFVGRSLWAVQEDPKQIERTTKKLYKICQNAQSVMGVDRLNLASRLGFSMASAKQMLETLEPQVGLFTLTDSSLEMRSKQLGVLMACSLELSEIQRGYLRKRIDPVQHIRPLQAWIDGQSYDAIAKVAHAAKVLEVADIRAAVEYCTTMSSYLSWSFGAAYTVLRFFSDEIDPYFGSLPLLARYGVPSLSAALVSLLGSSDRIAAQKIGATFDETELSLGLGTMIDWLKANRVRVDALFSGQDNSLRKELIERQLYQRWSDRRTVRKADFKSRGHVAEGMIVSLSESDDTMVVKYRDEIVAEVDAEGRAIISSMGTVDRLLGVITYAHENSRTGQLAITGT